MGSPAKRQVQLAKGKYGYTTQRSGETIRSACCQVVYRYSLLLLFILRTAYRRKKRNAQSKMLIILVAYYNFRLILFINKLFFKSFYH